MVFEKVVSIISEQFDIDEKDLCSDTSFDDIGADEIDINDLVITLEGEFDVTIDSSEISEIGTIDDLVNIIDLSLKSALPSFDI